MHVLRSFKNFKKIFKPELQIKLCPSLVTAKSSRKLSAFLNFFSVSVNFTIENFAIFQENL